MSRARDTTTKTTASSSSNSPVPDAVHIATDANATVPDHVPDATVPDHVPDAPKVVPDPIGTVPDLVPDATVPDLVPEIDGTNVAATVSDLVPDLDGTNVDVEPSVEPSVEPPAKKRRPMTSDETGGHILYENGNLTWCSRCGAYGQERVHRLRDACQGHPGQAGFRLRRLLKGRHPLTNKPFDSRAVRVKLDTL